jgi:hypothetical protein
MAGVGLVEAQLDERQNVVESEDEAGAESRDQTEAAEDGFVEAQAAECEDVCFRYPKNGPAYAVEVKRNSGDEQNGADGGEDYEGRTAAVTRPDTEEQFEGA